MDGIQETVYYALRDLARRVESGEFGEGDDFDDTSMDASYFEIVFCVAG